MSLPFPLALSLFGLALLASASAFTFGNVGVDLCPPAEIASGQHLFVSKLLCAIRCTDTMSCLGFCYADSDKNCLLFEADSTAATAAAVSAAGYTMFWMGDLLRGKPVITVRIILADTPASFLRRWPKAYRVMPFYDVVTVARQKCADLNSTLMLPKSDSELGYVKTLTSENWIRVALNDEASEGVWVEDYTGKAPTYVKWLAGQPSGGTGENCAEFSQSEGGYHDIACMDGTHFICETTLQ